MKKLISSFLLFMMLVSARAQEIPAWQIETLKYYLANTPGLHVVNFWATFCKPCIEELPHMVRISKKYQHDKVSLLLVSLDLPAMYPKRLKKFVKKRKYDAPVVWLKETNADVFCPAVDENWSGSIPATLFLNTITGYRYFYEGPMDEAEFEKQLKKAIEARL